LILFFGVRLAMKDDNIAFRAPNGPDKIDREVDNWLTISYDNDLYQTRSLAKVIRALMRREPDRLDLMRQLGAIPTPGQG